MLTHKGLYSRGYTPHIDETGLVQSVRFHLDGSIPKDLQLRKREPARLQAIEDSLDHCSGLLVLNPHERSIVEQKLLHFDGARYRLLAWVIMPNHVHVCFVQFNGWPLWTLLHSWKRNSAREINVNRKEEGAVWDHDFFDKVVRTEEQLRHTTEYVEGNPVKARLVAEPAQWQWSSARRNRTRWV